MALGNLALFGLSWLLIWALHLFSTSMLIIDTLTGTLIISIVVIVDYQLQNCWQIAIGDQDIKNVKVIQDYLNTTSEYLLNHDHKHCDQVVDQIKLSEAK